MAQAKRRFRPMGFGDILDEAFDLYKNNFVVVVGIPAIFFLVYQFCYGMVIYPLTFKMQRAAQTVSTDGPNMDMSIFSSLFIAQGIFFAILIILNAIVTGPLTYAISQRYLGESITIGGAYRFIFKRFGAYATTFILYTAIVFGPVAIALGIGLGVMTLSVIAGAILLALLMMASFVFMVLLSLRLQFMIPAFVVEGLRPIAALVRSWRLINGHVIRVFWMMLVTSLIVGIIVSIISGVSGQILKLTVSERVQIPVQSSIDAILTTTFFALGPIVLILLYYDTRIRKEGFDLQMLARDLAVTSERTSEQPGGIHTESPAIRPTCAHCSFPIRTDEDMIRCSGCGAVLHRSCWTERGGCTTPGCSPSQTGSGD